MSDKIRMRVTITAEYEADPRNYRHADRDPAKMAQEDVDEVGRLRTYDELLESCADVKVEIVPLVVEAAARAAVDKFGARKIQATKYVREQTGCGLMEGKEAVEAELARLGQAGRAIDWELERG